MSDPWQKEKPHVLLCRRIVLKNTLIVLYRSVRRHASIHPTIVDDEFASPLAESREIGIISIEC